MHGVNDFVDSTLPKETDVKRKTESEFKKQNKKGLQGKHSVVQTKVSGWIYWGKRVLPSSCHGGQQKNSLSLRASHPRPLSSPTPSPQKKHRLSCTELPMVCKIKDSSMQCFEIEAKEHSRQKQMLVSGGGWVESPSIPLTELSPAKC